MDTPSISFWTRFWLAWACFFGILTRPAFAAQVQPFVTGTGAPPLPAAPVPETDVPAARDDAQVARVAAPTPPETNEGPALQLLALLQREGRLIDFIEQDVVGFSDAEIGAAARVVHEGCRKAIRSHATLAPVRKEAEGARLELEAEFSPTEVKLSGKVEGRGPYRGVLRHRGWRVATISLPRAVEGYDPHVLAPAEVEI